MALKGTLGDFPLPDIFQLIVQQRKSGILVVKSMGNTFRVGIEDGKVVMADYMPKERVDYLGEMLLKAGLIDEEKLNKALEIQKKTLRKIGEILVDDLKAISREDLSHFLNLQIKEVVFKLLSIPEGEYEFYPGRVEYDREYIEPISAEFLLMEGMRMLDEWPQIKKYIPSFGMVLRRVKPPLGLSGEEERIYGLVDGRRTVREVIDMGRMGEFYACKIMVDLLMKGFIEKVEEKGLVEERRSSEPIRRKGLEIIYTIIGIIILIMVLLKFGILSSFQGEVFSSFIKEIKNL